MYKMLPAALSHIFRPHPQPKHHNFEETTQQPLLPSMLTTLDKAYGSNPFFRKALGALQEGGNSTCLEGYITSPIEGQEVSTRLQTVAMGMCEIGNSVRASKDRMQNVIYNRTSRTGTSMLV